MGIYDDKPWLARYGDLPAEIEPEFTSALAMFDAAVEAAGDRTAVQYFDTSLSYAEVGRLSDGLALGLRELGVRARRPGGRYLQNVPQFLITMVAAWKAGRDPRVGQPDVQGPRARGAARRLGLGGARLPRVPVPTRWRPTWSATPRCAR